VPRLDSQASITALAALGFHVLCYERARATVEIVLDSQAPAFLAKRAACVPKADILTGIAAPVRPSRGPPRRETARESCEVNRRISLAGFDCNCVCSRYYLIH